MHTVIWYQVFLLNTNNLLTIYDIKYSYQIQIICTQLYDIKYSYQIQIICTQLYDIKYSSSNPNNLHTVIWYQVFLSNTNNLHTIYDSSIPTNNLQLYDYIPIKYK